ncbi:MAG: putative conserved protein related to C-terminal domain of eukaryotic chaperone [Bacteroidetes bacterium]|nr:MAG: putative conserved protein related to C-terminal domain of eukaryotic chaperone [Bacteroidota bacterium]
MSFADKSDLIKYRLTRAKETLGEIHLHVENELWNTAVNRIYYACFYSVSALLLKHNINATTHSGVRQMFGLHFIKTGIIPKESGKFFSDIFDMRQTGDYDDFVVFDKEDVISMLIAADKLIIEIENLLSY